MSASSDDRWWAVGGSVKWIWDERYFRNAYRYIAALRFTKRHDSSSTKH